MSSTQRPPFELDIAPFIAKRFSAACDVRTMSTAQWMEFKREAVARAREERNRAIRAIAASAALGLRRLCRVGGAWMVQRFAAGAMAPQRRAAPVVTAMRRAALSRGRSRPSDLS